MGRSSQDSPGPKITWQFAPKPGYLPPRLRRRTAGCNAQFTLMFLN